MTPALAAFFLVAALLIVTPGPDMALVTRNALAQGPRAALQTGFGVVGGVVVWSGASLLGIAALLQASAIAFTVVKLAGASGGTEPRIAVGPHDVRYVISNKTGGAFTWRSTDGGAGCE